MMFLLVLLLLFCFPVNFNLGYHFNKLCYPMLSVCRYFYYLLTQCLDGKGSSDSKWSQEVEIHVDLHYHAYPGNNKLENISHRGCGMLLSPLDVMMRLVLYIAIFVKNNNLIAFVIAYSSFKERL